MVLVGARPGVMYQQLPVTFTCTRRGRTLLGFLIEVFTSRISALRRLWLQATEILKKVIDKTNRRTMQPSAVICPEQRF